MFEFLELDFGVPKHKHQSHSGVGARGDENVFVAATVILASATTLGVCKASHHF